MTFRDSVVLRSVVFYALEMLMKYAKSILTLVLFSSALCAIAEDWPQFRGPTGQGLSQAVSVPTEWSPTKNIAWKIETPGLGWSSPIVVDGKIYLTTAVGAGAVSLRALCIDATDGKTLWDTEVFHPAASALGTKHDKNSLASPTPLIEGGKLYVHFGHLGTAALDLAGHILWRQTTLKYPPIHGNGGSPVLVDGKLIFNCDGGKGPFVAALDAATGEVKWRTPRNTPAKRTFSFCTPLVIDNDGSQQLISPGSGFVAGYNPADGHELWRVLYGEGYSVVPRPVFAHGLLFLSSGFDGAVFYAVKPAGASGDSTADHIAWSQTKGAPHTPSALVVGDEVCFISDKGLAICADAATGKEIWSHNFGGNYSASPFFAEGRIYFLNEAGKTYVIKADKTFALIAENDLEEKSFASCAVTDGALFLRSEKHLWKIAAGK